MISENRHNTNASENNNVITSIAGQAFDVNMPEVSAVAAPQTGIVGVNFGLSEPKSSEEPPTMSDDSSLPLHDEQDTPQLGEVVQEKPDPINLVEAEANTGSTNNTADAVITDEAKAHANTEADTIPLSEASHKDSKKAPRKRRTRSEEKVLTSTVLQLLKSGHDPLAIALYLKESKTTVGNILVNLIADKQFIYTPPEYTIIRGGKFILDIKELGITKDGHAYIKRNADGELVIRMFDPEELAQDADCVSYQQ